MFQRGIYVSRRIKKGERKVGWEVRAEDGREASPSAENMEATEKGRQAATESFRRKGNEEKSLESTVEYFFYKGEPHRKRKSSFSQPSSDISVGVLLTDSQIVSFRRSHQSPPPFRSHAPGTSLRELSEGEFSQALVTRAAS